MGFITAPTIPLVSPAARPGVAASAFAGAGFALAGLSPAGFGAPAVGATTGPSARGTGAYLDPVRRDYAYDSNGDRLQGATVPQLVQIALTTEYQSSAQGGGLKKSGPVLTFAEVNAISGRYKSATAFIVAAGQMRIVSISVARVGTGGIQVTFVYVDLTTGLQDTAFVGA